MAIVYCLVKTADGVLKTFNSVTNRWSEIGTFSELTTDLMTTKGFLYSNLNVSLTNIYLEYTQIETYPDGSIVYESEDVTASMNATALEDYTDANGKEWLKLTVPAFTIKDGIGTTDKLLLYSSDTTYNPSIDSLKFDSNTTHIDAVGFTFKVLYNYNTPIKYRVKVNSKAYSPWSTLQTSYELFQGQLKYTDLDVGPNTITIQLGNETETKLIETISASAITVQNGAPSIAIINEDSNNFKVHFKIIDPDNDTVSYKVSLSNSLKTNLLLADWSPMSTAAEDIIYYIDTTNVEVGKPNVLKIEFKDQLGSMGSYTYVFTGQYRNLVFINENGQYYTTDKGVLLRILQFDKMLSGAQSDAKPLTIRNNNSVPITNLKLQLYYTNKVNGANVFLSKGYMPFNGIDLLDFGNEVLLPGDSKTIYVMIDSDASSEGLCKFEIDVTATSVA